MHKTTNRSQLTNPAANNERRLKKLIGARQWRKITKAARRRVADSGKQDTITNDGAS